MMQRGQRDQKDHAVPAVPSAPLAPSTQGPFIPPHGGYESLHSYQKARIVYDATIHFCARFLEKRDRTYDQMVQAARSGKQNIVEGSQVSGTSKELELKVTNDLLDRQIKSLERAFVEQGGLREAMTRARLEYRAKGRRIHR